MKNIYKPNDGEYPSFYKGYIDTLEDEPLIKTLKKEQAYTLEVLEAIPKDKAEYAYAEGKWTIKQVIIHMLDTEFVFGYRALAIARGEKKELPGFNQDEYMANVSLEHTKLSELIECFEHLRSANIFMFKILRKEDLERQGIASGYEVRSGTIGYFIAGHAKYHTNMLLSRYGI